MAGLTERQRPIEDVIRKQILQKVPHCTVDEFSTGMYGGEMFVTRPSHAEFIRFIDNGQHTSGQKRNILTQAARGEYICFVDDDDMVADNYVDWLIEGCQSKADVVSFNLRMMHDGEHKDTWKFGIYPNNRRAGIMCVNHLCAWKKELATRCMWDPLLGYADDRLWFEALYAAWIPKTNYHINDELYIYEFHQNVTANQTKARIDYTRRYINKGLRVFIKQDQILIETNPKFLLVAPLSIKQVYVRYPNNTYGWEIIDDLVHIHTIKS